MVPIFIDNDVKMDGLYNKRISMVDKNFYVKYSNIEKTSNDQIISAHIAHISHDLQEEGYIPLDTKGYISGKLVICEIMYLAVVQ